MECDLISQRVAEGASVKALARELGVSTSAVRRMLSDAGLQTHRQRVHRAAKSARIAGAREVVMVCVTHGELLHRQDTRGTYRCPKCSAMRVARHRRTVKEQLIVEAGGACRLCGYDVCARALSFHHVDPSSKSFGLALGGVARSLEKARAEAAKCILLCANCHMEVETGMHASPLDLPTRSGVTQWQSS